MLKSCKGLNEVQCSNILVFGSTAVAARDKFRGFQAFLDIISSYSCIMEIEDRGMDVKWTVAAFHSLSFLFDSSFRGTVTFSKFTEVKQSIA